MKQTRAFLIRGLLGWFYSGGLYTLADKMNQRNMEADVWSFLSASRIEEAALSAYFAGQKIALIGHSMGADAAVAVARRLHAASVPVHFLGCIDPTRFGLEKMPPNVAKAVCVTGTTSLLGRGVLEAEHLIDKKKIKQVYLPNIHIRLDDLPSVHTEMLSAI